MSLYENTDARMPSERVAIPEGRHYKLRLKHQMALNADPRKSGVINAVIGYAGLVVIAPLAILAITYQGFPALLELLNAPRGSFWFNLANGVIGPVLAFLFVAVVALINILMLRKYLGKVQNRFGPLHNGPSGSLQTVFDALKLVSKEDHTPKMVEETIFTLAPALVFVSAFLLMAVLPFAPGWVFGNTDAGAIFIIAAGTLGSYGVLLAGWSMNNKFGLLGGLRAAAQLVSYEVPLSIALLSVCVYSGSMNLTTIVEAQAKNGFWNVFPLFIPFVVYLIAGLAEIKMTPFDLPEAESELVAGFNTEYGGMRFGFFFVAEFAELYLLPAVLAIFFLGGWHAPVIPAPQGTFLNSWSGGRPGLELLVKANLPADITRDDRIDQKDVEAVGNAIQTNVKSAQFDANRDGAVDARDAQFVQSYVSGQGTFTGWQRWFGPGAILLNLQYAFWFLLKGAAGVYFYMWVRATLPRFRDDQLMELCWKFLIPLSLVGLFLASVSRLAPVLGQILGVIVAVIFGLWLLWIIFRPLLPQSTRRRNA